MLAGSLALAGCGSAVREAGDAVETPEQQIAVVREWLDLLSAGDVDRAAVLFAVPARFRNGGPTVVIRSAADAIAVTGGLPCGARLTDAALEDGYVVYEAELVERPGGDCGDGVGGTVRGAVRVQDGRMLEWVRLPDAPSSPQLDGDVI